MHTDRPKLQLEAGGAGRDALEAVLATLKGAADSLSGMAPTKQKQEAKARTPKPQRLINDATAETILAFAEKFDAAVAALAETHIPRAQALVVAVRIRLLHAVVGRVWPSAGTHPASHSLQAPAPEPEPVPEPVVAPTANHTHAIPALSKATEPSPPSAETPSTSTDAAPPSSLEPEHFGDIPDDPELAAALAMSMGGDAATEAAQAAVVVPEAAPAADTTSTAATPALAAAPSGATAVRARMIKTGVEMDLAVPEGTDVMPVRKFRELVAAVFGIEEVGAATLIVGGKQLKDGYTLSQSGATGAQTIFVGVDPNHAPITQQTSPASAPSEPTATTTTAGPARPATAAAAEAPGKPQLVAAMVAAITRMKAATDYVSLVAAVRTVVKLLDNLVK